MNTLIEARTPRLEPDPSDADVTAAVRSMPGGQSRSADLLLKALTTEQEAARALREPLEPIIAQLRHAYGQLVRGLVRDGRAFADGLIAPQIEKLEALVAARSALPQPDVADDVPRRVKAILEATAEQQRRVAETRHPRRHRPTSGELIIKPAVTCASAVNDIWNAYQTEQTLHAAWEKRAYEAEAALAALPRVPEPPYGWINERQADAACPTIPRVPEPDQALTEAEREVPLDVRRGLMACAIGNGHISYHWLCQLYTRGRADAQSERVLYRGTLVGLLPVCDATPGPLADQIKRFINHALRAARAGAEAPREERGI